MTNVAYTARAETDLLEIAAHIALDSPLHAELFIARLERKAEAAARNPRIYPQRTELARGLRSIAVGRYLIFYRIVANGIEIIRILHGARDLKRLFEA